MSNNSFQSFRELQNILDEADYSYEFAHKLIKQIDTACFIKLLENSLKSPTSLKFIANQSYIHQLGFEKYNLIISSKTDLSLRLHFWPTSVRDSKEDVHNHCASFCSRVLLGNIEHLFFISDEGGKNFFKHVYSLNTKTQVSELTYLGEEKLLLNSNKYYSASEIYSLENTSLHCVNPPSSETSTLSIWGPRTKQASVFRTEYVQSEVGVGRKPITLDEVRNRFEYLIKILG